MMHPPLWTPSHGTIGRALCVAASLSVFVALPDGAGAQTAGSFKFDFEGGSASTLTRPQNGLVPIRLLYTKGKDKENKVDEVLPKEVMISPSLFASDSGSVNVHVANGKCDSKNPPSGDPARFALTNTVQDLCLFVREIPADAKYTGNLVIQSEKTEAAVKPLTVTRPPATPSTSLVVSGGPNRVDLTIPNPWSVGSAPPFVVTVQEKSGKVPVEGLFVRMEVVSSPVGYDLKKVDFKLNDQDARDLPEMKINDVRRIQPGGQSRVEITLNDLRPGEYSGHVRQTDDEASFRHSYLNTDGQPVAQRNGELISQTHVLLEEPEPVCSSFGSEQARTAINDSHG